MTGTLRRSSRNMRHERQVLDKSTACSGVSAGHTIPSVYYAAEEASALPFVPRGTTAQMRQRRSIRKPIEHLRHQPTSRPLYPSFQSETVFQSVLMGYS
jgi:hypothetical protein